MQFNDPQHASAHLLTEKLDQLGPGLISTLGIPALTVIAHKSVIGFIEKRAMAKIRRSCQGRQNCFPCLGGNMRIKAAEDREQGTSDVTGSLQ